MKNLGPYREFYGSVEMCMEDDLLYGRVLFIDDSISYHASSPAELKKAFEEAVDAYIEMCAENGLTANKPCSGTLNVRLGPELHREIQLLALSQSISINALIKDCVQNRVLMQHTDHLAESVSNLGQHIGEMAYSFRQIRSSMQPIEANITWTSPVTKNIQLRH